MLDQQPQLFWDWILKNQAALDRFMRGDLQDQTLYLELLAISRKYVPGVIPEFSIENNNVALTLSADGMKTNQEAVNHLFTQAPALKNWNLYAFRQGNKNSAFFEEQLKLKPCFIPLQVQPDPQQKKFNLTFLCDTQLFSLSEYQQHAFLYLDNIIGELETMNFIASLQFVETSPDSLRPDVLDFDQLKSLINEKKSHE